MTKKSKAPFERVELVSDPRLLGARWWQERMTSGADAVSRRNALIGIVALGVGVTAVGAIVMKASSTPVTPDDLTEINKASLDAQKELGWNVGSNSTALTAGSAHLPVPGFDRSVLDTLAKELAPTQTALAPFYLATLFQSITAVPSTPGNADPFKPLRDLVEPVRTATGDARFSQGRALASLFEGAPPGRAVIVDLPGPEAVAFAAGLADTLDIVFAFDGWPHPFGVVPSHETLGAAAYYAPLFSVARRNRKNEGPFAIVLDRNRLAPYDKSPEKFDNRYLARVPSAADMKRLGVKELLYVSPNATKELDDLNADFLAYDNAHIAMSLVSPDDFIKDDTAGAASSAAASAPASAADGGTRATDAGTRATDGGTRPTDAGADAGPSDWVASAGHVAAGNTTYVYAPYYYGGTRSSHYYFWYVHDWGTPRYRYTSASGPWVRSQYVPSYRSTLFTSSGAGMKKAAPSGFSSVDLYRSSSTGHTYGPSTGSWGRSYSGFSGS